MKIKDEIKTYISTLPDSKKADMQVLHDSILQLIPKCKLWFLDGKNAEGKIVSNPNIGYGAYNIKYTDGSSKEFYQVGLSGNTTGISVYIMGIPDKKYLPENYGKTIGKATVTAYCIKFKALKDINVDVLGKAIADGVTISGQQ